MDKLALCNAFFRNDVGREGDLMNYLGRVCWSRQTQPYILNRNFVLLFVSDSFFKKVASFKLEFFLMRTWILGIILAIFGLWLATI